VLNYLLILFFFFLFLAKKHISKGAHNFVDASKVEECLFPTSLLTNKHISDVFCHVQIIKETATKIFAVLMVPRNKDICRNLVNKKIF